MRQEHSARRPQRSVPVAGGTASSCFASRWSRCSRSGCPVRLKRATVRRGNGADYNLFQGTELTEALSATTPQQLLAAVATDFGQVQKTNFPKERRQSPPRPNSTAPDLIGVQEAALWRTGSPSGSFPPPAATTTAYDFVQILRMRFGPMACTTRPSP